MWYDFWFSNVSRKYVGPQNTVRANACHCCDCINFPSWNLVESNRHHCQDCTGFHALFTDMELRLLVSKNKKTKPPGGCEEFGVFFLGGVLADLVTSQRMRWKASIRNLLECWLRWLWHKARRLVAQLKGNGTAGIAEEWFFLVWVWYKYTNNILIIYVYICIYLYILYTYTHYVASKNYVFTCMYIL